MGKKVVLPTTSIFGITDDPSIITEKLFLYFITSEYSQSVTFYGKITSLKYYLNSYATDTGKLRSSIYDSLITLYKKYFDNVTVEVDIHFKDNSLNTSDLVINIKVTTETEDGVVSTVDENVAVDGVKITNLLDMIYR